jgi:predicted dehydrogenase
VDPSRPLAAPADPACGQVSRLGVGTIGAGLVTRAIHLPALAALAGRFRVVRIMDVDERISGQVAAQAGARFNSTAEELLADATVELIVVRSTHQFHADQPVLEEATNPGPVSFTSPADLR